VVCRPTRTSLGISADLLNRYSLRTNDLSAAQYLKTVSYKAEIAEFKEVLQKIGKRQGWELNDLQQRFSNRVWDEIIFDG